MLGTFLFLVENKHALFVKHALGLYFSLKGGASYCFLP